ncbi:MAG: hypothetical protein ACK5XX_07375 [Holosporales bacterium]|jgi:hypothetical protein
MQSSKFIKDVTYQSIQDDWQKSYAMPTKERLKFFRTLGNDIVIAIGKEKALEPLEFYIGALRNILQLTFENIDRTALQKALTSALAKQSFLLFGREPAIQQKLRKNLKTESGSFLIADCLDKEGLIALDDDASCKLINEGAFLRVNTGADGVFSVTLLLVDVPEPILPKKEARKMVGAFDTAVISVSTGKIYVFSDAPSCCSLDIEAGNYKICSYYDAAERLYVVLAKTNMAAENALKVLTNPF